MTKDSIDKVVKARNESSCIVLELYCEQTNCAARQVVVTIKDHDNILVERLAARQPCPLCGKPLKFHLRAFRSVKRWMSVTLACR